MECLKWDHIKRLITITNDYIKRLSLYLSLYSINKSFNSFWVFFVECRTFCPWCWGFTVPNRSKRPSLIFSGCCLPLLLELSLWICRERKPIKSNLIYSLSEMVLNRNQHCGSTLIQLTLRVLEVEKMYKRRKY